MEEVLKPMGWGRTMPGPAAWLRRLTGRREAAEAPLSVEGRLSLGPKKWLVLVNCRGRRLLVAVSGDSVTPVLEMDEEKRPRRAKGAAR